MKDKTNKDTYDIIKEWFDKYLEENPIYKGTHVGNGQILFWLAQKEYNLRKKTHTNKVVNKAFKQSQ